MELVLFVTVFPVTFYYPVRTIVTSGILAGAGIRGRGLPRLLGKTQMIFFTLMSLMVGVPDLPEGRGKLCAAYDPSGAVLVCGGGERFWRPNANCWQLLSGAADRWRAIPQMYPVHGAAVAFFQGKFWVLGGSTGDDSYDHTITDKVQAYEPRTQEWSVESPLSSPRHKACAVAIEDRVVITGGTMLGLGKVSSWKGIRRAVVNVIIHSALSQVKPVWLAEIGTRTAEEFDGEKWTSLPSMSRAKVRDKCVGRLFREC